MFLNQQVMSSILSQNGRVYKLKVLYSWAWDMDTNISVTVAHGLNLALVEIIAVQIFIIDDNGTNRYQLPFWKVETGLVEAGLYNVTANNVNIARRTGGFFDGVDFNDAVMNRGKIMIWYREL